MCLYPRTERAECRATEIGNERYEALPAGLLKQGTLGIVEDKISGDESVFRMRMQDGFPALEIKIGLEYPVMN